MPDALSLRLLLASLAGWFDRRQQDAVAYLIEENRILRGHVRGRIRLTDAERRRLAVQGHRLGRRRLRDVATIVTPDTILRWHRQLIARKWTYTKRRGGRLSVRAEIRRVAVRMAQENPTWGYTRILGALKNVGHRVSRSSIARILKAHGIPPVPERPTSWQVFLRAHWGAIAGADFFTTEVWTWRGLVTYYTVFVIDLASRCVQIVGSTLHPHEAFMQQVVRTLTAADEGLLVQHRLLLCDRDTKWSAPVRARLGETGITSVADTRNAIRLSAHPRGIHGWRRARGPQERPAMNGRITRLIDDRQFGTIAAEDGNDYVFHGGALVDVPFGALHVGATVTFAPIASAGPRRAEAVRPAAPRKPTAGVDVERLR